VLVEHGLSGWKFEMLAASLAIGGGVLVHRCIDLPVRAALRRLPDRVARLTIPYRDAATIATPKLIDHLEIRRGQRSSGS